jgi:hypothetical protein
MVWAEPLKVTVDEADVNVPELVQLPALFMVSVVVTFHVPSILIPPVPAVTFPPGVNMLDEYTSNTIPLSIDTVLGGPVVVI